MPLNTTQPSPTLRIPLKAWKHAEADRLGIDVRALESRLSRGRHPFPPHVERGPKGRVNWVIVKQRS